MYKKLRVPEEGYDQNKVFSPRSEEACFFCNEKILGKPHTYQREYVTRNFCGVQCWEQWDTFMETMERESKRYSQNLRARLGSHTYRPIVTQCDEKEYAMEDTKEPPNSPTEIEHACDSRSRSF